MTTKDSAVAMRRCIGSTRFGVDAHEAPADEFPAQPSQKDGLGRMCKPHWKQYTSGLRNDALARKAGETTTTDEAPPRPTRRRTKEAATPKPSARVERAEALISEVDDLPGPEMVARVGDDDVQVALETVANGGTADTPLAEALDAGAEEADAA